MAAAAIGLVTAEAAKRTGRWRIDYQISRAKARQVRFWAHGSLGRNLRIETPGRSLASRKMLPADAAPALQGYRTWVLTLDKPADGAVHVDVRYERPTSASEATVPLIRPIAAQTSELLAVQAGEEIAVEIGADGAAEIDAIELPPLPGRAGRILAAFRLQPATSAPGAQAAVRVAATLHGRYDIPSVLAGSGELTTHLGADLSQRTEAIFRIANAGMQFLSIGLPAGAPAGPTRWRCLCRAGRCRFGSSTRTGRPRRPPGGSSWAGWNSAASVSTVSAGRSPPRRAIESAASTPAWPAATSGVPGRPTSGSSTPPAGYCLRGACSSRRRAGAGNWPRGR